MLVIRVLYRLRFLSEQAPFDAATFSYAYPLLGQILLTGGIPGEEDDDPLEQVALVLEILSFHGGECKLILFQMTPKILIRGTLISFKSCLPKITSYRKSDPYYSSTTQAWQGEFVSSCRGWRGHLCNCISGTNGSSYSWNSCSGIIRQELLFASTPGNSFVLI